MVWYALENIEEALQDSKELLIPFNFYQWMRLAVIILLTGYVVAPIFTSIPFPGTDADFGTETESGVSEYSSHLSFETSSIQTPQNFNNLDLTLGAAGLAIIAGIASLIIFLTYITSVFEFVMYRSLAYREVKLSHAREYLFEGLQFFIFRWITRGTLLLVLLGGAFALFVSNPSFTAIDILTALGMTAVTSIFVAGILLLKWIVFNFALPDMVKNENNLVKAFSYAWKNVRSNLRQVIVFWAVKIALGVALGILTASILAPALLIMLIPFAVIGLVLAVVTPLLAIPIILVYVVLALVISLFVTVPVRVYMYYYILEMYEDIF